MPDKDNQNLITEFYKYSVKDLMDNRTWDLPVVDQHETLTNVFTILSGKNHIWVVDNKKTMNVVGVITERDALSLLAPAYKPSYISQKVNIRSLQYNLNHTAEDIMTKKPVTTTPDEKIPEVLTKMDKYRIRRLPVVDENNVLLGEITLHQLIYKYHNEQTKKIREQ